jgi:lysozyme family protein
MAEFEPALKVVLDHEGGAAYTAHPADHGGPTKWGVTLATLADWRGATVKPGDVEGLSFEEAAKIYRARYWDAIHGDDIEDQQVATKCLDIVVNMGVRNGSHVIQLAVTWAGKFIIVDSIVGANTLKAMNSTGPLVLLGELRQAMRLRYMGIAALHPEQNVFLKGWLNRADWGVFPVPKEEEGLV